MKLNCGISLLFLIYSMRAMERPPRLIDINAEIDCTRQLSLIEALIRSKPLEIKDNSLLLFPHYQIPSITISAAPSQVIKDLQNPFLFLKHRLKEQQKECIITFASRMISIYKYSIENYVRNALSPREKLFFHPFIKMLGYIASAERIGIQVSPPKDYFDESVIRRFKLLAFNHIDTSFDDLIAHYAQIINAIDSKNLEQAIAVHTSSTPLKNEPSIDDQIAKLISDYCE